MKTMETTPLHEMYLKGKSIKDQEKFKAMKMENKNKIENKTTPKTAYTIAPWRAVLGGLNGVYSGDMPICAMFQYTKFGIITNTEAAANAKLIAAAPELLNALQRALCDFKGQTWTEQTYDLIENTIKKATE